MTITAQAISSARQVRLEEIVERHGIKLRGRIARVGPCPICGGRDRFGINVRKRLWNCRGCRKGGDVIALMQFLKGCSFVEALQILSGEAPSAGELRRVTERHRTEAGADDYERRQRDKARRLWRASRAAAGTTVESYLRARGIALSSLPTTVRFLPPLKPEHHPAMIVAYGLPQEPEPGVLTIAEDAISAVQLTLLKPDGSGKADVENAKLTIASPASMPMVLAPPNDLLGLAICEGVEDALSAHQATGLGAWAAGGASFMPRIAAAIPDYVEAVTVFAHADTAGQRAARELADALIARGIEVRIDGIRP